MEWKAQVDDLSNLIKSMDEQKNKEVRSADKKNITDVLNLMRDQNRVNTSMLFIMDRLVGILAGDSKCNFQNKGQEIFSVDNYATFVRKAQPDLIDKDDLKAIALRINVDSAGQPGDIQREILQVDQPTKYILFFAHFKILFKLVQMGLSMKRMNNLTRKLDENNRNLAEVNKSISVQQEIIANLACSDAMLREANNIRTCDLELINNKVNRNTERARQLESRKISDDIRQCAGV